MMADAVLRRKTAYLNVPFFLARAAVYFAVWMRAGAAAEPLVAPSRTSAPTRR